MSRYGAWPVLGLLLSFATSPAAESQLTSGGSDQRPAWSPDGTTVVFDSNRSGNRDLWSVSAAGGTAIRLTTNSGTDWDAEWSPSSTTIAYSGGVGGSSGDLYTIPAGGGMPAFLAAGPVRFPSWSPDSTRIAYSDGDIWVVPVAGGTPVQLTTDPANDAHPSWSPDGASIAFHSNRGGNNDVWVVPSGGGVPVRVTTDPGNDAAPDWSPDGARIAFQSNRAGNNDIWVIGAGGGAAAPITVTAGNDVQPDWGPDGEIAFARGGDLWVFGFPAADLGVTKTVDTAAPFEGDTIVFTVAVGNGGPDDAVLVEVTDTLPPGATHQSHAVTRGSYDPGSGLWEIGTMTATQADTLTITATVDVGTEGTTIVNTAAIGSIAIDDPDPSNDAATAGLTVQIQLETTEKRLTTSGSDRHPAWSPDGRTVAFDSNRSGKRALWSVPATGGTPAALNTTLASGREPGWSPTSDAIVFSGDAGGRGGGADLYVLAVGGAGGSGSHGELSLLRGDPAPEETPAWSPDGTTIAYSDGSDLWLVPSTGGAPTRLTTDPAPDAHPAWSPDGTQIAFVSGRAGSNDIWVIPAAGGPATTVTDGPSDDGAPAWSPSGNRIAFRSDRSGSDDIWVVAPGGGLPSRVTRGAAAEGEPDWAPNGTRLAFTRDGDLWIATIAETPAPGPDATGAETVPGRRLTRIDSVRPNPARAPRIGWELPRAGHARLAIYDPAGRLVRELVAGAAGAGPHVTAWDGRNGGGRPVPSGVYFVRLEAAGSRDAAKVVVVR